MKHDAEQDGEQETEQAGTDMEQSGTSTEQHVEQDVGTDETRLKTAVQWKQQGKTYREIEDGLGVPKSTLHRYLKRSLPNTRLEPSEPHADPDETDDPRDGEAETGIGSHPSLLVPAPPSFPQNGVLFDYGMLQAIEDTLTTKQAKVNFRAAVALSEEKARLNRNNGHGQPLQSFSNDGQGHSGEDEFYREMAKTEKFKRALMLRDKDSGAKAGSPADVSTQIKQVLDAIKLGVDLVPKGGGRDPIADILAGNQMRESIEKNVQSQYSTGVQKSRIDLELEAMQQSERLDYKKLEFDERQADKKEAAENKKWEFAEKVVKFLGSDHAGAAIEAVGASMADKIRGSRVPMTTVICPHCTGKFRTNPELPHAMCPNCGAMLDKPTEQQPRAEPETETPKPEPEPSADVSTDAVESEPEKLPKPTEKEVIT
jgi:hypothetical protein